MGRSRRRDLRASHGGAASLTAVPRAPRRCRNPRGGAASPAAQSPPRRRCEPRTSPATRLRRERGAQAAAAKVGVLLAERAKAAGLEKLYFDRKSGQKNWLFHGRVKALVDGVREGGVTI